MCVEDPFSQVRSGTYYKPHGYTSPFGLSITAHTLMVYLVGNKHISGWQLIHEDSYKEEYLENLNH